jgi:neutral/alkaline ceramidase-like enzyme
MKNVCGLLFPVLAIAAGADYRAGVARLKITPQRPIFLSGYAARTHASTGIAGELWAKAVALEDRKHGRVVIVSTDLIGLPRAVTDVVAARVAKEYGLERSRLLLNSSHTHAGPLIRGNLEVLFDLAPADSEVVSDYTRRLTDDLVTLVGAALGDLRPANLWFGNGRGSFAANRRQARAHGVVFGVNSQGPSDHDVPVLKVTSPEGGLRAVLFGYACHNTTLEGSFYEVSGDYAGYAQEALEKANPGASAMFLMLCGADQNPNPRGTLEIARRHGEALAAEVGRVMSTGVRPVRGNIRTAYRVTELDFAYHTRDKFEAWAKDANVFKARNARLMLKAYDDGRPVRRSPYPAQAIAFGKSLTLVALGGEVVVDYVLRIKKEFGAEGILVAGYSNDVMSYIPSLRVLKEGGYEPDTSMIYYGLPGPYNEEVEDRVMAAVYDVMKKVGR